MDGMASETRDIFLAEAKQHISSLQELLMDTEDSHNFSLARIAELFRLVHTLKGSAAMMGYAALADVTHQYEDDLAVLRDRAEKHLPLAAETMKQAAELGLDFSDLYLAAVSEPSAYTKAENFISLLKPLAELGAVLKQKTAAALENIAPADVYPPELWLYERVRIKLKSCGMAALRAYTFQQAIVPLCDKTYTMPGHLLQRSDLNQNILKNGFELGYIRRRGIENKTVLALLLEQPLFQSLTPVAGSGTAPASGSGKDNAARMLSVKADDVTKMLDLVADAMTAQTLLYQRLLLLGITDAPAAKALKQLRWCTQSLQIGLDDMGLLELGQVFLPLKRLIRKLLSETGKQAEIIFSGGTVMVERGVLHALNDALLHLVRNAVDHGIETPAEREAAGKTSAGQIKISAREDRERLIVDVADNGHGIDRDKVLHKAKERGLLTKPESAYTQDEIYQFILQSGFSTNEKVTQNSGRGVGLDVVHDALKKIGGFMVINSTEGQGTTITLNLPISLTVLQALCVQINERQVYIPSSVISKIAVLNGSQEILADGSARMGTECWQDLGKAEGAKYLVLFQMGTGTKPYGLSCQKLGSYETVFVKKLPEAAQELLGKNNIYLGCLIDSLGKVRCILDIDLLIQVVKARGVQK